MLMLAEVPIFVVGLLVALFVIVSVMMMLIVLIQRPQGGGLTEAFGSASGSGHTAFGAKTGDALTYATITIFVVFIGMAVGLNYIVKPPMAVDAAAVVEAPVVPIPTDGSAPLTTIPPAEGAAPTTIEPAKAEPAPVQPAETPAEAPEPSEEAPAATPKD